MFGLHRRWRGALVGHLAVFEMCSVGPMGRYRAALERLGFDEAATRFYSEHVLADERHQVVALHEMAAQLVEQEPMPGGEVIFVLGRASCRERVGQSVSIWVVAV